MSTRRPEEIVELLSQATALTRDLMEENERLRKKLGEAEVASQKFADRFAVVSEQSELLQNLFVVIHQLHQSLDRAEVIGTIKEVVINLVGSEDFALWSLQNGAPAELLAFEGDEAAHREQAGMSRPLLRQALEGEPVARGDGVPVAVCALKVSDRPVGAIVIRNLLRQKPRLTDADQQILELLCTQGAAALVTAQLHAQRGQA